MHVGDRLHSCQIDGPPRSASGVAVVVCGRARMSIEVAIDSQSCCATSPVRALVGRSVQGNVGCSYNTPNLNAVSEGQISADKLSVGLPRVHTASHIDSCCGSN